MILNYASWVNAAFGTLKTTFAQLEYVTAVSNITVMSHMDALPRELKKRMSVFAPNNFDRVAATNRIPPNRQRANPKLPPEATNRSKATL